MAHKQYKKVKTETEVKESPEHYSEIDAGNDLHFFSSFEEMNEADLSEMASMTAEESFTNATFLIKQMFAKEFQKKFSGFTIHFR